MIKYILLLIAAWLSTSSFVVAGTAPINAFVESRCIIQTDVSGTYGNPNAYTLSTDPSDGGEPAVIRYDVSLADSYYAEITAPQEFSSSPAITDVLTWAGDTEVKAVSDATGMGQYEVNKVELGMMDRYDLLVTGSTWFKTSSQVTLGGNKAFPGGNYTALVIAECIAK